MHKIDKRSGYYLKKYSLENIIKEHSRWSNECTEEKNMEAKKAIIKFYHEYKKCKPDRIFCCREELGQFSSYLMYLLPITEALFEGLYQRACNELYSLLYQDYFLQERIMEDVLRCIEVFLESEIAEYEKAAKQKRGGLQWIRTNLIICKR
jgi:hypothetical protein